MKREALLLKTKKMGLSLLRVAFLIAFSFILIYPVFFMAANAVKTQADIMNPAVKWLSRSPTFQSFDIALKALDYPISLLNTVRFELVSAVLEVFSCAFFAYGLARFELRFKPLLMFFLILIIFMPDIILVIPRMTNFRYMDLFGLLGLFKSATGLDLRPNLTDTVFTFYLPSLFGVGLKGGLFMFIYMQFFKGLPKELEEAAYIDGAGPFATFFRVIIPSSGVVILTVFIFAFIWHWNDWLLPMMYTSKNQPLSARIYDIDQAIERWSRASGVAVDPDYSFGIPLAACLLFIAPPTVIYLFLQKKFIQSIDRVGIVG
jgi:multiple sugar transport system permease protein